MIFIDKSRGSKELYPLFKPFSVPVMLTNLVPIGGDAWFEGNGPDGEMRVGIELKTISDLIASMGSNRLEGHQLPIMYGTYDIIYVIVQGIYRPNDFGGIEEFYSKTGWKALGVTYREVDNFMNRLMRMCMVKRSSTPEETVHQIVDLYKYWSKPYERHSGLAIYSPKCGVSEFQKVGLKPRKTKWVEKFAYILPGIDAKTQIVGEKFGTIDRLVRAPLADWPSIPGVGKITADKIRRAILSKGADL